ncbi:endonuclease/exonuclease/phosphatase family protein [Archangium sp.]|uniref:endonuclease/exonuclease/phosphatase family protein n=1 Tax=Archangium sp. TaxID=1872627 RepID=UPI00286AADE0|nr:endonuclease/exonuclease/phosphatase family protein [Archangium sp.]
MIIIFWNVQRPGETGLAANRLDAVLDYLNTLTNTYAPDFICLCEVAPALIVRLDMELARSQLYGGVGYMHQQQVREEYASAFSFGKRPDPSLFSEASCSFYVIYRRATCQSVRLSVTDGGRYAYNNSDDVWGPDGRSHKVAYQTEARPLVLVSAGTSRVFGLVHLISGNTRLASEQLTGYLRELRAVNGDFIIGDMNIPLGDIHTRRLVPTDVYTPHDPGYDTHPGTPSRLDYLWTNRLWQDVDAALAPPDLIQNYFVAEGRLSDHVPVVYRLDNAMFRTKKTALPALPFPPRTVVTRHSKPQPQPQPLWKKQEDSQSSASKPLVQKSMLSFLSKAPTYQLSGPQAAVLALANRQEIPVDADGDCLFASLIAMGVQASDGTTFHTVQALRNYVATVIRTNADLRLRLMAAHIDPLALATQVATPRYWFGHAGDLMPELIAVTLGIRLAILNANGLATNVGSGGTQYPLIRFNPPGGEHYHGTRPHP